MKHLARLIAVLALAACAPASDAVGNADYPTAAEFAADARVGNIYSCITRSGIPLFFRIGAIDDLAPQLRAYSVQIIPAPEGLPPVQHAPFVAESFAFCLPETPSDIASLDVNFDQAGFDEGYQEWRRAEGGVFDIEITQIYSVMDGLLSGAGQ